MSYLYHAIKHTLAETIEKNSFDDIYPAAVTNAKTHVHFVARQYENDYQVRIEENLTDENDIELAKLYADIGSQLLRDQVDKVADDIFNEAVRLYDFYSVATGNRWIQNIEDKPYTGSEAISAIKFTTDEFLHFSSRDLASDVSHNECRMLAEIMFEQVRYARS